MSDINRVIAEFCGWKELRPHLIGNPDTAKLLNDWPAYTSDLDACAEAERKLTDEQWELFADELARDARANGKKAVEWGRGIISAKPEVRAAALAAVITAQKDTP